MEEQEVSSAFPTGAGGQAAPAGKVVFHFATASIETEILKHVYPQDKTKALEMLIELMKVDQLISQQVREAQLVRQARMPSGLGQQAAQVGVGLGLGTTPEPAKPEVF